MTTPKRDIHLDPSPADKVRRASPVVTALVLGGLVGAGAMMLLAPQSGKETRSKIQHKTLELRDRAVGGVRGAVKQVTSRTNHLKDGVRERAEDLEHYSRDISEKLDAVADAAKKAKKAIRR
jgi:gas vesicle protein